MTPNNAALSAEVERDRSVLHRVERERGKPSPPPTSPLPFSGRDRNVDGVRADLSCR